MTKRIGSLNLMNLRGRTGIQDEQVRGEGLGWPECICGMGNKTMAAAYARNVIMNGVEFGA